MHAAAASNLQNPNFPLIFANAALAFYGKGAVLPLCRNSQLAPRCVPLGARVPLQPPGVLHVSCGTPMRRGGWGGRR